MTNQRKTIILLVVTVVVIAGAVWLYNSLSGKVDAPETQTSTVQDSELQAAPDFTVVDADGENIQLSDFKGKPVVLNFWASWCPPCKQEMPHFDKAWGELGDEIAFVMVDLVDGQRETQEKGAAYIADSGYGFPVYFDTTQEAATVYSISSIPTTLFIDAEGYVVTGAQGMLTEKNLYKGIAMIQQDGEEQ